MTMQKGILYYIKASIMTHPKQLKEKLMIPVNVYTPFQPT